MVKSDTASNSKPETTKVTMSSEKLNAAKTNNEAADLLNPTGSKTTNNGPMEWLLGKSNIIIYKHNTR